MPKEKPNKRYTPEFKFKVVETMQKEKLSYSETARQFEVSSDTRVKAWERIYLEEGKEGFYVERRGRKSTGRPHKLKKEVARRKTAHPLGHPTYIVAWVMIAAISSLVIPCFFAFCK